MNLKMRSLFLVLSVLTTVALAHSCFKQKLDTNVDLPKIDRAQLCGDGGATIDVTTNECICSGGTSWNGARCDVAVTDEAAKPPEPEPAVTQVAPSKEMTAQAELTEVPESEAQKVAASSDDFLALVRRACRIGNGTWLQKSEYCHCPDGKVLMGRRCRPMNGRMIDDVCLRAVNKGTWNRGVCECAEGEVFSPGRGGCVKNSLTDKTLLRRICENTMNKGRWNDTLSKCGCPAGKMMIGETCENKSKMSSAEVCESPANAGKWDLAAKRCDCPDQKIWSDQSCLTVAQID